MENKITIKKGIKYALFNLKWRCNNCQEENFDGDYFCKSCLENLPFIKENKCSHCGRVLLYAQNYCESCIEKNLNFDKALSVFSYEEPINNLIMQLKYNSKLYLAEVFSSYLSNLFFSNVYDSDVITYVPMTKTS
jgi:predicted amidophosphoribosyltransferase